jgi:hypothetical protein
MFFEEQKMMQRRVYYYSVIAAAAADSVVVSPRSEVVRMTELALKIDGEILACCQVHRPD